jgi:outer membrane protein
MIARMALGAFLVSGLVAPGLAAPAQAQIKVAVIDVQRILQESARGEAVQKELEQLQNEKRGQIEAKQNELAELRKSYAEMSLTLADDRLADMQKQIEDLTISLRRMTDDANVELQKRSETLLKSVEDEVLPIINQVGNEGGYTMIFNKFQSGLIFADEAIDITQQVIERYNSGGN